MTVAEAPGAVVLVAIVNICTASCFPGGCGRKRPDETKAGLLVTWHLRTAPNLSSESEDSIVTAVIPEEDRHATSRVLCWGRSGGKDFVQFEHA